MKRIIISIAIIAVIIAMGCSAVMYIGAHNSRLYGHIDRVLSAYSSNKNVADEIESLKKYFARYEKDLGAVVNEDILNDMSASISKLLSMYLSQSDEFSAECEAIRSCADRIQKSEIPAWHRIL